jgi:hypothetical protein
VEDTTWVRLGKAIWDRFPPLTRRTSPQLSAALGFFFGGIGLAIYFRSFVDFIAPIAIAIVASLIAKKLFGVAELGLLAGAIIASLYGLSRSQDANRRLDEQAASAGPPEPAARPS